MDKKAGILRGISFFAFDIVKKKTSSEKAQTIQGSSNFLLTSSLVAFC